MATGGDSISKRKKTRPYKGLQHEIYTHTKSVKFTDRRLSCLTVAECHAYYASCQTSDKCVQSKHVLYMDARCSLWRDRICVWVAPFTVNIIILPRRRRHTGSVHSTSSRVDLTLYKCVRRRTIVKQRLVRMVLDRRYSARSPHLSVPTVTTHPVPAAVLTSYH